MKLLKQNFAAENILPGDRVLVAGKRSGTVHFVGNTEFAPGVVVKRYSEVVADVSEITVRHVTSVNVFITSTE